MLLADDGEARDFFGSCVATSNDTVIIGALDENENVDASGLELFEAEVRHAGQLKRSTPAPDPARGDAPLSYSSSKRG